VTSIALLVILAPVHFVLLPRRAAVMKRAFFSGMVALCLGAASAPASALCRSKTCGATCTIDTASGCPVEGKPLAWAASCLSYSLHRYGSPSVSDADLKQVADAAFRAWWETTCPLISKPPSISVRDVFGTAACGRVEFNSHQANANMISIRETWNGDRNQLALTTVSFSTETGEIYDADMEINGAQPLSVGATVPGRYDLQSIITHEAGHFLGLAHSNRAGATMSATYMPGVNDFITLDADDIAGICTVYEPGRSAPACDPTPHRGFSAECGLDPVIGGACSLAVTRDRSPAGVMAFALGLGLLAARPRPRRRAQKLT
jgi:hypothetical protein